MQTRLAHACTEHFPLLPSHLFVSSYYVTPVRLNATKTQQTVWPQEAEGETREDSSLCPWRAIRLSGLQQQSVQKCCPGFVFKTASCLFFENTPFFPAGADRWPSLHLLHQCSPKTKGLKWDHRWLYWSQMNGIPVTFNHNTSYFQLARAFGIRWLTSYLEKAIS